MKRIEGGHSALKEGQFKAHPMKLERKKRIRQKKWEEERNKWLNNTAYQKKQQERLEYLKAKAGYEKNIEEGKRNKGKKQTIIKQPLKRHWSSNK